MWASSSSNDNSNIKDTRRLLLPCVLVFAASILSYWSSLDGGFVFDDHRAILTNEDLDSEKTSLWEVFQHDFWGGPMSRKESHKSYRPLTVLTFRYFNFWFSGLEPYGYHLVNVLLHSLASILVFLLSHLLLGGGCRRRGEEVVPGGGGLVQLHWSMYAAITFAVHSIHTEAVASIVGRAEVVCSIFFLLSLLAYCKAISEGGGSSLLPLRHTKWGYVAISLFFGFCAMLSKEQGVVVIGGCACFDLFLNWEPLWGELFDLVRTIMGGGVKNRSGGGGGGGGSSCHNGSGGGDGYRTHMVNSAVYTQGVDAMEDQNGGSVSGVSEAPRINGGVVSVDGVKMNSKVARRSAASPSLRQREQYVRGHQKGFCLLKEITKRISKLSSSVW